MVVGHQIIVGLDVLVKSTYLQTKIGGDIIKL